MLRPKRLLEYAKDACHLLARVQYHLFADDILYVVRDMAELSLNCESPSMDQLRCIDFRFSPHRMLFLSADLPIYAARIDGIGCKIWWCNTKPIQTMLYLLRKFTGFINYEYNLMAQFVCNPYMLSCASLFVHLSCWFFCVVSYNPFGSAGKEAWRSDIFGLRVCEWMSGR